jgi:hypothetical protein
MDAMECSSGAVMTERSGYFGSGASHCHSLPSELTTMMSTVLLMAGGGGVGCCGAEELLLAPLAELCRGSSGWLAPVAGSGNIV